jgi:putative phosphoribosyl transferase
MRAALRSVRRREPARLIAGAPVGAPDTCAELAGEADEVVCVIMPPALDGVSLWYDDFSQTTDDEVRALLQRPTSADA